MQCINLINLPLILRQNIALLLPVYQKQCIRSSHDLIVRKGTIVVTSTGARLCTVVGSGLSVCIWDSVTRTGGMCHFVEPVMTDPLKTTVRYGNVALYKLVKMMRDHSPEGEFEAYLFGGAAVGHYRQCAQDNITIARDYLWSQNIPVISEECNGSVYRKVRFDTTAGKILVDMYAAIV